MNTTTTPTNTQPTQAISRLFRVLGDATRLKIMQLLLSQKNLCVGEVAQQLSISTPATSQHLRLMELHGLLEPVRNGQHISYQPNFNHPATATLIQAIKKLEKGV